MENNKILFRQLFETESSTYTYIVADKKTKEAIIVDPVKETLQRDLQLIDELDLNLKYILDTHIHADHISSSHDLKEKFGAKIVLGKDACVDCADVLLGENETIKLGEITIKGILTPGHTNGCISYFVNDEFIFSGDTLLIRSIGRTDFQQGDPAQMYDSVKKLYELNDSILVYPSHNYEGIMNSTIGEEKKYNKFFKTQTSKEEFIKSMIERKLPMPQKINVAVPSNEVCGEKVIEKQIA